MDQTIRIQHPRSAKGRVVCHNVQIMTKQTYRRLTLINPLLNDLPITYRFPQGKWECKRPPRIYVS
jgi:hypothetical protein